MDTKALCRTIDGERAADRECGKAPPGEGERQEHASGICEMSYIFQSKLHWTHHA